MSTSLPKTSLPQDGPEQQVLSDDDLACLIDLFRRTRAFSERICAPLEIEDYVVQPVPWVSPPKWHLAHSTWFFVNFCLHRFGVDYAWPDATFPSLFNSYYKSEAEHWEQGRRGDLSRPTVAEVMTFRAEVENAMLEWLNQPDTELTLEIANIVRLGIEHEQQHQELLMMDIKYILWCNPSRPAYFAGPVNPFSVPASATGDWLCDGGLVEFGVNERSTAFCFDNETPPHQHYVAPFSIASSAVSNREYLAFINDGGYRNPLLWLSDGWDFVQQSGVQAPLYWHHADGHWFQFDLYGLQPLDPHGPVSHLSYYEAWAFARWSERRLPTEYEWQLFADQTPRTDDESFLEATLDQQSVNPHGPHGGGWEWTASPYSPYPGYRAPAAALGEYNGKFMVNQMVLRGGCQATPRGHYRTSYRNFYHANQRWLYSGLRLAGDHL